MKTKVLCYLRGESVRVATLEEQREQLQAECDRRGWIPEFVVDRISARGNSGDSGWSRLQGHLADSEIRVVVLPSLSSVARSVRDAAILLQALEARGITLVSITEGLDTSDPLGRVLVAAILLIAQFESDVMSKRRKQQIVQRSRSLGIKRNREEKR
jgi:DNA invertase Pin-like site-specific DNA recombinase